MLPHPTNPDLVLNLPHLKERNSTRSNDNGSGTKSKALLYSQSDNSEDNGHQVKKN